MTIDEQIDVIRRGVAQIIPEGELRERLSEGRPLRVKLGVDPTAPDLHLGHTVVLTKLRALQDLGHHAVLIIGDYTSLIGDPSGRSTTRPLLGLEEIESNAKTYQDQVFKILDPARAEIRRNGEWFSGMRLQEVISLAAKTTVARMLERDDFENRHRAGTPIGLHEFLYPLLQGYDSVMVGADLELGGTDQTFNLLVGRDLQRAAGMRGQLVLTLPLLEGTDGIHKMSKSLGNHVALTDPAEEMYGKLMSISDDLMGRYRNLLLLADRGPGDVDEAEVHPLERKKQLAWAIVARFHGEEAAVRAAHFFEQRFQRRETFSPEARVIRSAAGDIWICRVLKEIGFAPSTSEARRLASAGAVRVDGQVVGPDFQFRPGTNEIVAIGRRRIAAVRVEPL